MKKICLLISFLCVMLVACTPDPEKPTVSTKDVSSVTSNSANVIGDVTNDGGAEVTVRGICWSTSEIPVIENDAIINSGNGIGSYEIVIENLAPFTTYFVRAYAINSVGTSYGETKVFTTKKSFDIPTVTTSLVSDITETSVFCGGNVISDGGAEVTSRGLCWSDTDNPTIENGLSVGCGSGLGNFEIEINELKPSTTYYIRAYAVNSEGVAYGDVNVFATKNMVGTPEISTNAVYDVTATSAVCGGNITSDGGSEVTLRGVCWSMTNNPTMEDALSMGGGSGVGSFEVVINDLTPNTKYYVRAYAVNSKGTSYGEEVVFTTVDDIPPTSGMINGYEWVDLGLASGTKWATRNVGAFTTEEYGDFYAWGETKTKTNYETENSVTHGVSMGDISGDPVYDVARNKWGSTWRMPKRNEMEELYEECEWVKQGQGYKVTGPNGNSIYLPAAGCHNWYGIEGVGSDCYYWTSTPYNNELQNCAYELNCAGGFIGFGASGMRCFGYSVRPVSD